MGLVTAIRFLTVIPLPKRLARRGGFGAALPYFPVVGLLVGVLAGGLDYGFSLWVSPLLGAALAVAALLILSGGHHLDGLIDTFDGIGAANPEARLAAMRGSHAGAAGMAAAVLALLAKFAALTALGSWLGVIAAAVLSRSAMVNALYLFPSARREGMAAAFKAETRLVHFIISNLLALGLALALLGPLKGLTVALGGWLLTMALAWGLAHRLGGLTGDTLGAVGETGEVILLIIMAVVL